MSHTAKLWNPPELNVTSNLNDIKQESNRKEKEQQLQLELAKANPGELISNVVSSMKESHVHSMQDETAADGRVAIKGSGA